MRVFWPSCLLLAVLLVPASPAQTLPDSEGLRMQQLQQLRQSAVERAVSGPTVALEGAIDPEAYEVGPGDEFLVGVGGAFTTEQTHTVSSDGFLVIPGVGGFEVAGQTLAAAKRRVEAGLQRVYRNVDTQVALARPRRFYVHVSGEVARPGRHVMVPVARVEDALFAAMDNTPPLEVIAEAVTEAGGAIAPYLPSLRNVVLRRGGRETRVDLRRYYATGEARYNPYLLDGDEVYVPAFQPYLQSITVDGEVATPGTFEFRPDDTVLSALEVAAGPSGVSGIQTVRLVRAAGGAQTLDVAAIRAGTAADPPLAVGDHLNVLPSRPDAGIAEVVGEVAFPGRYPIVNGETTIRTVLELAGGVTPDALVRAAYVERRGTQRPTPDAEPGRRLPLADLRYDTALRLEETYAATRLSGLAYTSRQFLSAELLRYQRVSVDLEAVLSGSAADVPLRDGDRLVVPEDPRAVLVSGQVQRAGYVPVAPGQPVAHYLEEAGGRASGATQVFVRDASTGAVLPAEDRVPRSGDIVFVDREAAADAPDAQALVLQERQYELQERQDRRQQRYQFIQTIIGAVTTAASVAAVIIAATAN